MSKQKIKYKGYRIFPIKKVFTRSIIGLLSITSLAIAARAGYSSGKISGYNEAESSSVSKQTAETTANNLIEKYGYYKVAQSVVAYEYNKSYGTSYKAPSFKLGINHGNVDGFSTSTTNIGGEIYGIIIPQDPSEGSGSKILIIDPDGNKYTAIKKDGRFIPAYTISDPEDSKKLSREVPQSEFEKNFPGKYGTLVAWCVTAAYPAPETSDDEQKKAENEAYKQIANYLEEEEIRLGAMASMHNIEAQNPGYSEDVNLLEQELSLISGKDVTFDYIDQENTCP